MSDDLMDLLDREAATPVPPVDVDDLRHRGRRRRRFKQAAIGAAAAVAVAVAVPTLSALLPSSPVAPIEPVAPTASPDPNAHGSEPSADGDGLAELFADMHSAEPAAYMSEERFGEVLGDRQDLLCSWAAAQVERGDERLEWNLGEAIRNRSRVPVGDGFAVAVAAVCGMTPVPDYPVHWEQLPPYTWGDTWRPPPVRGDAESDWLVTVEAAATGCEPNDLDGDGDLDCSGPVSGNYPWTVDDYNQAIQLVKPSHALAADPEASEFTQEKIVYEMLVRSWEAARDNIADPDSPGPRW